jgi:hypothetical protein
VVGCIGVNANSPEEWRKQAPSFRQNQPNIRELRDIFG